MQIKMNQEEFDDKRDSETASIIFGKPFILTYQSGKLGFETECILEFTEVKIEG